MTGVQVPPQQSVPTVQMSPACPQYEPCEHTPPKQKPEAQSMFVVHGLPSVEPPPGLSFTHAPLVQVPLQHSALALHAFVSAVHGGG
jgi:hypothetical protein